MPLRALAWGDAIVLLAVAALIYAGLRLAVAAPPVITGPVISLSPQALPWYALLSISRMAAAYVLSLLFSLTYGSLAARSRRAERWLLPLLDVLQSVPILSFLPVVLLGLSAFLPEGIAAELASIVLIFTSQAWNLTFSWYQSQNMIPAELREASAVFRFNGWLRFKTLELPFAAIALIWNSMMSWAGGWFFLMAAEIFSVGRRDFRLPGLGAYLREAAAQGDARAILWGIGALVLVIVALDQLVWRPLLAWSERFKLETVESETPSTSWSYELLRKARLPTWIDQRMWRPLLESLDAWTLRHWPARPTVGPGHPARVWFWRFWGGMMLLALGYGGHQAALMLLEAPSAQWGEIGHGLLASALRVVTALAIALTWTLPVGVAIGTRPHLAAWLQPLIQILASVPATALFPVFVLLLADLPGGLDAAAVVLMLTGTQWYLLFNVIAGVSAIPQDLKYTAALLGLGRWQRWRLLILPSLFPYLITGAITAGGGAWNASIVAEYVEFSGRTLWVPGLGATIARATASGDYPLLLAATLTMITAVVLVNRLIWRRLYRIAEERYRLE